MLSGRKFQQLMEIILRKIKKLTEVYYSEMTKYPKKAFNLHHQAQQVIQRNLQLVSLKKVEH
jgi:hypothetical protein